MSAPNWKEVAPKRSDWERISAACEKAGIPRPCWLNGIPTGLTDDEMKVLEGIATGKAIPSAPPKKQPFTLKKKRPGGRK
jgi:hypothetical protein